jgi:hypothetical protein
MTFFQTTFDHPFRLAQSFQTKIHVVVGALSPELDDEMFFALQESGFNLRHLSFACHGALVHQLGHMIGDRTRHSSDLGVETVQGVVATVVDCFFVIQRTDAQMT